MNGNLKASIEAKGIIASSALLSPERARYGEFGYGTIVAVEVVGEGEKREGVPKAPLRAFWGARGRS